MRIPIFVAEVQERTEKELKDSYTSNSALESKEKIVKAVVPIEAAQSLQPKVFQVLSAAESWITRRMLDQESMQTS